ncbi:hypothetical protein K4F52_010297 [Lecanicillium sp. MT-2017a]|nr:hypothetical protein K4F52_010297 [Lecanicillium sp. MT-2017a]
MSDFSSARIEGGAIVFSASPVNFFNSTIKENATIVLGGSRHDLMAILQHRLCLANKGQIEAADHSAPAGHENESEVGTLTSSGNETPWTPDSFEMVTGDEAIDAAKDLDLARVERQGKTFDMSNKVIGCDMHLHYDGDGNVSTLVFRTS